MTSVYVKITRSLVLAALLAALTPSVTMAQDGISASPKGTIGAALIGAELGLTIPALFDVNDTWPYLVAPAVGAGAGVVLGLLVIDKDSTSPKLAVSLLGAGTALFIPALVLAVSATTYDPEEDFEEASVKHVSPQVAAMQAGTGLLRFSPEGTFLAAPAMSYSPSNGTAPASVEVSVISGLFD